MQGEAENAGDEDYDTTPDTSISEPVNETPIEDVYDPDAAGE